jgi:hypothetical protein
LTWFASLNQNCQDFIISRTGLSETERHYIDLEEVPKAQLQLFVDELTCFEEIYAANLADEDPVTLDLTVLDAGEYEPDFRFDFYAAQFGSGFPLIHTGEKSSTDRFDATNTSVAELCKIQILKKQPRFAKTNCKWLSFTIPNPGTLTIEEFGKFTSAIRKAQYLGANTTYDSNWKN